MRERSPAQESADFPNFVSCLGGAHSVLYHSHRSCFTAPHFFFLVHAPPVTGLSHWVKIKKKWMPEKYVQTLMFVISWRITRLFSLSVTVYSLLLSQDYCLALFLNPTPCWKYCHKVDFYFFRYWAALFFVKISQNPDKVPSSKDVRRKMFYHIWKKYLFEDVSGSWGEERVLKTDPGPKTFQAFFFFSKSSFTRSDESFQFWSFFSQH